MIKRDGSFQEFDSSKIQKALILAFRDFDVPNILPRILESIVQSPGDTIDVSTIQSIVENTLMVSGFPEIAKNYIIYRHERDKARSKRAVPDPNAISDYIHAAKYARHGEIPTETRERVYKMHCQKYGIVDSNPFFNPRVLPSMRSMQFAGEAIFKHNARMYNCSYTLIDRPHVFADIFYLLLCGCGCGFSVQWDHVSKLPTVLPIDQHNVAHFTIPDSIEGWREAVLVLCQSYFENGTFVEFDYSKIRSEGTPLKTSGGFAPGHLGLKRGLENIRNVFDKASGRQLRPIECHDIVCYLAEAVLSGGIRRSSLISIFSASDTEMMYCKSPGAFDPQHGINSQRMMANNSVLLDRFHCDKATFDRVLELSTSGYGEPGFYFSDSINIGPNPCGEIILEPKVDANQTTFAFCNLTEIDCSRCDTKEKFLEACEHAAYIGTLQAGYTRFDFDPLATIVAQRDALLGVSLTGILDNLEVLSWLDEGYDVVRSENERVARLIGIAPAKRLTCIKPSGTASLLLGGIAAGCHPHHARRYYRRVTANPNESVAQEFKRINPHMVEVKPNGDWALVFPIQANDNALTLKDCGTFDHLKIIEKLYQSWVDHSVSATVVVDPKDLKNVADWIWERRSLITCLSFVPPTLDQIYPFAPRETMTDENRWNYLINNYREVDYTGLSNDGVLEAACDGGKCDVK